jgi:hypothetical protein
MRNTARILVAAILATAGCSGLGAGGSTAGSLPSVAGASQARLSPIPCSQIATIRGLHRQVRYVKDSTTGNTLEYLVVGDAALAKDVFVMFPGTGQIMTGWPIQMITNSTYSPKIVGTAGYKKSEDGSVSLCHNYRLLLFDYPGVGHSPYASNATHDAVAQDVDTMLQDVTARYRIPTDVVDPLGWSLGTTYALKYAFLSPASRPSRKIHDVFLVAGHGGGSLSGDSSTGTASCVTTLLSAAESATGSLATQVKIDASKLIFPYEGQSKTNNGTNSNCDASVGSSSVTLSVTPECSLANNCTAFLDNALESFATEPWRRTKGIDSKVYAQQREESGDWNVAYCSTAGANFTSTGCTAYGTVQQSVTNGGICQTDTANSNVPVATNCDALTMTGKLVELAGYEDLFIQWTYGKALVDGLNAKRAGSATATFYSGLAGHGIMIQHPRWTQAHIQAAM